MSHIATVTGWTFAEIARLTLWEVNDLFSYWRDHPPLHVLLGACLLKPPAPSASAAAPARNQVDELKHTVAALGGAISKKLPAVYRQKSS